MPSHAPLRIHFLDSIRGLAAITVFLSHLVGGYPLAALESLKGTPAAIFWHGEGAVSLFFVLSGLVLSLQFFQKESFLDSFSLVRYGVARLFRIMPLFWAVVLLSYAGHRYFFHPYDGPLPASDWLKGFWQQEKTLGEVWKECLLLLKTAPASHLRLVPQDWTLAVELIHSLALPFLVMLCLHRCSWMVFFVVFGIKLLGLTSFCFPFMLGVVLARYAGRIRDGWPGVPLAARVFTLAAAVLLYCSGFLLPGPLTRLVNKGLIDLTALGSFLFLVIALGSKTVQALLNRPFLRFLGKLSYGVYLTHLMLLLCLTPYVLRFLHAGGIDQPYLLFAGGAVVVFTATVLLSYVTHYTIEQPGIRLGKLLLQRAPLLLQPLRLSRQAPRQVKV